MENVHVMAGVPRIMRAMFEALAPTLKGGAPILSHTVHADYVYEARSPPGCRRSRRSTRRSTSAAIPITAARAAAWRWWPRAPRAAVDQAAAECFALLAGLRRGA